MKEKIDEFLLSVFQKITDFLEDWFGISRFNLGVFFFLVSILFSTLHFKKLYQCSLPEYFVLKFIAVIILVLLSILILTYIILFFVYLISFQEYYKSSKCFKFRNILNVELFKFRTDNVELFFISLINYLFFDLLTQFIFTAIIFTFFILGFYTISTDQKPPSESKLKKGLKKMQKVFVSVTEQPV